MLLLLLFLFVLSRAIQYDKYDVFTYNLKYMICLFSRGISHIKKSRC